MFTAKEQKFLDYAEFIGALLEDELLDRDSAVDLLLEDIILQVIPDLPPRIHPS
ncbi:MAG: hypothetical protein V3V10_05420 [Planctomycetota bacterium]